jgi:hypothetical protein
MKAHFEKVAGHIIKPADQQTAEWIEGLNPGQGIYCELKKERDIGFHRKFFKMLNIAYENSDTDMSFESFRKSLIISAGYFEPEILFIEGEQVMIKKPKSISFANMDQSEFEEVYNACLDALIKWFGVDLISIEKFI